MFLIIFNLTAIVFIAGMNFAAANIKQTTNEITYNFRISPTLISYSLPISDIEFIVKKFDNNRYLNIESQFNFPGTINKYISISSGTEEKNTTVYKSITPNVFKATQGYYEITAVNNINYQNIEPFRFYIDSDLHLHILSENRNDVFAGESLEHNAKLYDKSGVELFTIKNEDVNIFEFLMDSKNSALIKNTASDYSQPLIAPENYDYSDHNSEFLVSYFNDSKKDWTRLKNPDGTIKKFVAELEKFGSGKRKPKSGYDSVEYQYSFLHEIPIVPNTKYKIEQFAKPQGYNDSPQGSSNLFSFTFSTDKNCKVDFPIMESKTYAFFGDKYKEMFKTADNSVIIEKPTAEELAFNSNLDKNRIYTIFHIINISNTK